MATGPAQYETIGPSSFLCLRPVWTFLFNILGPIGSGPIPFPSSVNKPLHMIPGVVLSQAAGGVAALVPESRRHGAGGAGAGGDGAEERGTAPEKPGAQTIRVSKRLPGTETVRVTATSNIPGE